MCWAVPGTKGFWEPLICPWPTLNAYKDALFELPYFFNEALLDFADYKTTVKKKNMKIQIIHYFALTALYDQIL